MRSSWPIRPTASRRSREAAMAQPLDTSRLSAGAATTVTASSEAAPAPAASGVAFIEPRIVPIQKATDLGSVQVLKHENLFLLTDPFGDIHPDSRGLGLYLGDTRILSCEVLRVGGARPVLLQGSAGGNFEGTIHLTNPSIDRNPGSKRGQESLELAGRTLGISRERQLGGEALVERVAIVNHSELPEIVDVELELADDSADIFEVRGYPRPTRGDLLPIAVVGSSVTFRYDGRDGLRRQTHLRFSEPPGRAEATDGVDRRDSWITLRWHFELPPGGRDELTWTVWATS